MKKTVLLISMLVASACINADTMKPEDSVEYRQAAFRLMGFQLNVLNPLHRSQSYADEAFAYRSEMLSRLGELAHEGFTEESQQADSRASSRIWENQADFDERMRSFIETTANMAEASRAGDNRETRNLFRQTLQSCRSCHDQYRLD